MEIFRELYIRGEPAQLNATVDAIERSLPDHWVRDKDAEARVQTFATGRKPAYCFASDDAGSLPAAALVIMENEPGTLYVSNIVPRIKDQLHYGEYNAILEYFCDTFVRPAAAQTGVTVDLTTNEADLCHWLSADAAQKLRAFSVAANKNTGSAHPSDRERWNDFLVTTYRDGHRLDTSTLQRWLVEVEKWRPEVAEQLAIEYEFSNSLLDYYEHTSRGD
jgi:hypothetical protein